MAMAGNDDAKKAEIYAKYQKKKMDLLRAGTLGVPFKKSVKIAEESSSSSEDAEPARKKGGLAGKY